MSNTPSNSSSIQVPIRIHPQQPGMLRSDTGIQTGSNTLQNSTINSQVENTTAHQTNSTIIPQISNQSVQYRVNQPTPIFHTSQNTPTFNTNLNTFDGVPIPPVLRPYQPSESKELLEVKDIYSNKIIICKIYGCRQINKQQIIENEYLCTCSDSPNIQYAKWISQSQVTSDSNGLQKIHEFNESNLQSDFLSITSTSNLVQSNPISPVEIICQYKDNYLFRFKLNNMGIFCWDHNPFTEFYSKLITDFQNRKKIQRKAPNITNGVKFILDSIQKQLGLIFCGEKNDIIEFLSVYTGKVAIVTNDADFNWWCNHFEEKSLSYVGYRGDDFTRAIIRQFQITNRTVLLLITYSSVITDFSFFDSFEFDCLIADDGERLKNPHGRKRNALQSINCKYRIVLTSKLKEYQLQSIQNFVKNDEVIYFNESENTTKYIFVRPTDYQLALLASNPYEADKICQNGFLINPKISANKYDQSINVYERYSAKFLFLGKVAKNAKVKIAFIFKSRKLLNLCASYLDSIEIPCKSPENKEAEALIALFFSSNQNITNYDIKIAVDCKYTEPHYRLILYGTREHYFFSKKMQSRNIQKVPIAHVPSPPLISFEDYSESLEFDDIVNSSASLVLSDIFDFQSLGISEFLEKWQIKEIIHGMCLKGFEFDENPLFLSVGIALFRAINPENVTKYPLSFFKLVKETQVSNTSSFLCNTKKNWLDPIKTMYQTVDFTPIKELKKYFFRSAEKVLKTIENKMIVLSFFRINDNFFKFEMLPPFHRSTPESDKNILISMQQGLFPLNDEKRIENIIDIMKYDLIMNDFHDNYIFPFWTENEVIFVANEFADFGGSVPPYKLPLLSKSNEAIQNLKAEISRQLTNGSFPIKVSSITSPSQKVASTQIPQFSVIPEQEARRLEIKLQLGKSLRASLPIDSSNENSNNISNNRNSSAKYDAFLSSFARSQKVDFSPDVWFHFLKGLIEFGISSSSELLLSRDLPFRATLTETDVAFLEGRFALLDTEIDCDVGTSSIPPCLLSDAALLSAVSAASRESRAAAENGATVQSQQQQQQQRPLQTMPIVSSTSASLQKQPPRNYSPPNELLQRAADLQNQKRFEKKKMKQMKPIIPVLPAKKPIHQTMPQMQQGHFMQQHQLPLPIPQQQPLQPPQQQPPPPPPMMLTVKTVEDKPQPSDVELQKQQQPPQPSWPRQQFYMPSVEIGRKVTDNNNNVNSNVTATSNQPESIVLPPKKRPISVVTSPSIHQQQQPPQPLEQHQIHPVPVTTQPGGIVEPLKATHVRMSQAVARQMMNEDFLKSLPHTTRQSGGGNNGSSVAASLQPQSPTTVQPQIGFAAPPQLHFPQPPTMPQVNDLQTDVSLLPPKKKHLVNSPPK